MQLNNRKRQFDAYQEKAIEEYLKDNPYLDIQDIAVQELSQTIVKGCTNDVEKVQAIYTHVRDTYGHSADAKETKVSISAKDVITNGHGICYAKSNLLAALLRCQELPTGYCYQRLTLDDDDSKGYCIHALNAVYINETWYRIDARGNKSGVDAQFSLTKEQLAFPVRAGYREIDYPIIYASPLPCTMKALLDNKTVPQLMNNLPNII